MRARFVAAVTVALLALTPAAALAGGPREEDAPPQQVEPVEGKPQGPEEPAPAGWYASEVSLFVDGSQVNSAPSGREVRVVVSLNTDAAAPAEDVRVTLDPTSQVRVVQGTAEPGVVQPGTPVPVEFVVEVREQGCAEFTGLLAKVSSSLGESVFEFGFPVLCPGVRLYLENVEWVGGDGDGVPEPGEVLDVFVTLRNNGRDPAAGVRGTLAINTGKVTILARAASWPEIPSGEAGRNAEPLRVEIADDAERSEPCQGMVHDRPVAVDDGDAEPAGEPAGASMTLIAPAPDAPVSGEPGSPPVEEEPESQQDLPAIIDATLSVQASGSTVELGFGSMVVCALAEQDAGAAGPAEAPAPSRPHGSAPIAAVLAAMVAALLVRYRAAG